MKLGFRRGRVIGWLAGRIWAGVKPGELIWWTAASLRVLKSRAELWRPRISGKRG